MAIAAYLGFLLWIAAGAADFILHRRSDLPHTSGLAESRLHLLELVLVGGAIGAWWALAPTWTAWSVAAVLVALHALAGYLDTRSAWRRRDIVPIEQHVHSVLDAMPWVFLGGYALNVVPGGLHWQPRAPELLLWIGVPAAAVGLLALMELRAAWMAARGPRPV